MTERKGSNQTICLNFHFPCAVNKMRAGVARDLVLPLGELAISNFILTDLRLTRSLSYLADLSICTQMEKHCPDILN